MVLGVALLVGGCATMVSMEAALNAIGLGVDGYCKLSPAARQAVRVKLKLENRVIDCPRDRYGWGRSSIIGYNQPRYGLPA